MTDKVWCDKHKHYANESDEDIVRPCHFCGEDHNGANETNRMHGCLCVTLMPDEFKEMRRKRQEDGFD